MQWLREWQLVGVGEDSQGLDFSGLRVQFDIRKTATPTPNEAKIRIINLSVETAKKAKKEFKRFQLKAGYQGQSDVIFDGNVKEARIGKDGTDTYLDILGGDGDQAYIQAAVNRTLASGCTLDDVFAVAVNPMLTHHNGPVVLGHIDYFDKVTFPRGRVIFGMARDLIEQLCIPGNKTWSIQDGRLQLLDHKSVLPEVFVISEDTGMVEVPEEVNDGVRVCCLLNPKLQVDAQVQIESNNISDVARSATGFYRILQIDIFGDTHGKEWFSDLTCVALDKEGGSTTDGEGR